MPANLTDVDAFTSPVVVPVDGDVRNAASVVQGFQPLADRTRNLQNKVRTDLTDRGCFISGARGMPAFDTATSKPHFSPLNPASGSAVVFCQDIQKGRLSWDIYPGDAVPFSCRVTTLRAFVERTGADPGAGLRMELEAYKLDASLATTLLASQEAGAGTGNTSITISGLTEDLIATNTSVYVPGETLGLRVVCYAKDVASPNDRIYFLEVRYTLSVL